ncbi:C-type lectin mosGCTL-7-like [Rhynchophorus ferrugineus]|uniref:C-type lectin mosGCTL-7-like n=1 Tax=Rhynchophorus ferrugineus TaxID=354439 RepID=UPI003FCEA3C0
MRFELLLLAHFIPHLLADEDRISTISTKYVVSNQKITFFEAYTRCRQYGLDPAEVLSEADERELEEALKPFNETGPYEGFWIFATDLGDKANYYWLHSNLPLFYSLFSDGEPNNVATENCLEVFQKSSGIFSWNDCPCDLKLRFVCQRKQKVASSCGENVLITSNTFSNC